MTLKEYRQKTKELEGKTKMALEPFIGSSAASKLVKADLHAALNALRAFNRDKARDLSHRLTELERAVASVFESEADSIAKKIATHLASIERLSESGRVKITLPGVFRVHIAGLNRRYEYVGEGRVRYAPIKRRKK